MKQPLFPWIARCCELLGKDKAYGALLMCDVQWAAAWDDGLTPEQAVESFRKVYPQGYSQDEESEYLTKKAEKITNVLETQKN